MKNFIYKNYLKVLYSLVFINFSVLTIILLMKGSHNSFLFVLSELSAAYIFASLPWDGGWEIPNK